MKNKNENRGMRLLKNGRRGISRIIFSRMGIISLLFLLQAALLVSAFVWLEEALHVYIGSTAVITVIAVLFLLNREADPTSKITWLVIFMLMPVLGIILYFYTVTELGHRALGANISSVLEKSKDLLPPPNITGEKVEGDAPEPVPIGDYLKSVGNYACYNDSAVKYFSCGEEKYAALLSELEKAKRFIFLEYFIISEGEMWGSVLEILARKAREGVEVRVMYDGTCEFTTLTPDYASRLKKLGIEGKPFSPLTPFVSTYYNFRDHRKIAVIDGKVAFTGGVNLADEYINVRSRFGHWKDAAVMIKGGAVNSFTLMFLQMWAASGKKTIDERYFITEKEPKKSDCYVIPYGDFPLDNNKTGERVYMDMLNRASRYVYIMTPYLILDSAMETAIRFAAERGVDVRIILPGIPDKKTANALAKTHYKALISSGVKLYEYAPGFVHSKVVLCDDTEAVVGTINMDYRSFYHNFECAAYIKGGSAINEISNDFEETFGKCRMVTKETVKKEKPFVKLMGFILKVIAPLM